MGPGFSASHVRSNARRVHVLPTVQSSSIRVGLWTLRPLFRIRGAQRGGGPEPFGARSGIWGIHSSEVGRRHADLESTSQVKPGWIFKGCVLQGASDQGVVRTETPGDAVSCVLILCTTVIHMFRVTLKIPCFRLRRVAARKLGNTTATDGSRQRQTGMAHQK